MGLNHKCTLVAIMAKSRESEKLAAEITKINSQMAALDKIKRQRIAQLSIAESPQNLMSREERREVLAEVFAEAILYLDQRGMLPLKDDVPPASAEKPAPFRAIAKRKQKRRQ